MPRLTLLALLLVPLAACDDAETSAAPDGPAAPATEAPATDAPPAAACVPSQSDFEAAAKPVLDAFCNQCHGESLQFGAPMKLVRYADLIAGAEGDRVVDAIAEKVILGSMPPAAQPQPADAQRAALVEWATCGAQTVLTPPNPIDTGSDRPVLTDPGTPPAGAEFFDLRAPSFAVENWDNRYECFTFQAPVNEERFIRRIETLIGDARVLHHTVLIPGGVRAPGEHGPCQNDNPLDLIYGWAPGQGALHFEEGGLRLAPGELLTLQIHYNNRARHQGVRDKSGVRIYHGPVEGPEVGMLALGPVDFEVAPMSQGDATGYCRLPRDTKLIASFPHMHETGVAFDQVVERADGTVEPIIRLADWDFEAQYIYDTPMQLGAGDRVKTTCTFRNMGPDPIGFGPNTEDEMCFNFAYISPPMNLSLNFCNTGAPPPPVAPYSPGECAPTGAADAEVSPIQAELRLGQPDTAEGGELPSGLWMLAGAALYLPSLTLGPITVDADATVITAQGLLGLEDGKLALDADVAIHLVTTASDFDQDIGISLAADAAPAEANPVFLDLGVTCGDPALAEGVRFTATPERLTLYVSVPFGPTRLPVELWFTPLP